jgi:S1-C subfamily serine protease
VVPPAQNDITGADVAFGAPLPVIRALVTRAGESTRPWVGITFAEILGGQSDVAAPTGGLRVRAVDPEGPGARAALRGGGSGDVVVAVDGRPVRTIAEFGEAIAALRVGDTITLQVLRRGALTDVSVTLAARPRDTAPAIAPPRVPSREPAEPPTQPSAPRRAQPRRR